MHSQIALGWLAESTCCVRVNVCDFGLLGPRSMVCGPQRLEFGERCQAEQKGVQRGECLRSLYALMKDDIQRWKRDD